MALSPGDRLGPYEITAPVGAGAMGEVYRARDVKLGREVALKILPAAFAQDADRLARFEREAKLLASLKHPNIATVHGLEEAGGVRALVMELVEGEDLSARIARGRLPFREVLDVARQIAHALAAAHEGGVIHRDLKPGNVVVGADGTVKVLDFGLAKSFGAETRSGAGEASAPSMTVTSAGTSAGMILGTAAYMSPEQARGKAVDRKTDVWSFGCVVYEMLTGLPAFPGETVTDVLAAIVHDEPDWDRLPPEARPRLERLLRRCLAKDRRDRAGDLGDIALMLREIASDRPGGTRAPDRRSWKVAAAVAAVALLGGAAAGAYWLAPRQTPADGVPAMSFRQLTMIPGGELQPSISPDGESFVYVAGAPGNTDIFLQRIDGRNAVNLTASCPQDDVDPAFSPDGRLIAYHSDCSGGGLFVMGATGESVRKVSDVGFSPAWSPDGREIAVVTEQLYLPWGRSTSSVLSAVDVETGRRRVLSEHDAVQPTWSPDGRRVAFWGLTGPPQRDLFTVLADGSQSAPSAAVNVTDDAHLDWSPAWSQDGRHLYFSSTRGGTLNLWRLEVDPQTGGAAGRPVPVTAPSSWVGWISLSRDGRRLVFVDRNARTSIVRAPFDSARGEITGPAVPVPLGSIEVYDVFDISPDGDAILFSTSGLPQHLFVMRVDGSGLVQLTDGPYRDRQGAFSPDGSTIAFQTTRGQGGIGVIRRDGSGLRGIPSEHDEGWYPFWTPDGRRLVVSSGKGPYFLDPAATSASGSSVPLPAPRGARNFSPTSFSPDGRSVAGNLWDPSGRPRGFAIRSLADGAQRIVSDSPFPEHPRFLPDGRRAVVALAGGLAVHDLATGTRRQLVAVPPGHTVLWVAISRDGRHIAWLDAADESDIWMATLGGSDPD